MDLPIVNFYWVEYAMKQLSHAGLLSDGKEWQDH